MAKIEIDEYLERFDDWINANPAYRERLELFKHMNAKSPRGMVLVPAAELDRLLFQALQGLLADGKGLEELIKDNDGPLSTFSARINLAHALRIINDEELRDLHLIRKIRNDFAHHIDVSFETPAIVSRVRELSSSLPSAPVDENLEKIALFLTMQIDAAIQGIKSIALPDIGRVYGPDMDESHNTHKS